MGWKSLSKFIEERRRSKKGELGGRVLSKKSELDSSLTVVEADLHDDCGGPSAYEDWTAIRYSAQGVSEGMTPILRDEGDSHYKHLRANKSESVYGVDVSDGDAVDLAKLGYVRVYFNSREGYKPPYYFSDPDAIRRAFTLERDFTVTSPSGHDSFIIRMESGEVYSEYYGPNWKNHIWDGYSREWAFFPRMAGADDGAKYILGECVLHRDFLAVDGGLRKYMLAVTQILLDAEMEKIS